MPHRLHDMTSFLVHAIEAVILGIALGWNWFCYQAAIISDEDWSKITGPHGVAFIAVCAVVVLWFNKLTGEKSRSKELAAQMEREDERREAEERNKEKRHEENLAASREYAEGMKALAVESMKTTIVVNHTLKDLIKELKNRPCNIGLQASQLIKDSGEDLTEKADPE